jgi:hypothetical protein
MRKDTKTMLFNGSTMTKLEANLLLLEMKSRNVLSDKGFDDLLTHFRKMIPRPNELPENTYQAKQMICPIELKVQKIHMCYNDCILYHNKDAELDQCPVCETSRYKSDSIEATIVNRNKKTTQEGCVVFPYNSTLEEIIYE